MQQKYNSITICNKTYRIEKILGEGSYGKVYLGFLGTEKYAIKAQQTIGQSEMDLLNQLKTKHFTNLVNTYDIEYNQQDHKTYVVMEHCEQSLYDEIQKKTIAPQDIRYVMKQIAIGIKELHDLNFTHRDLKPENILIKYIIANREQQKIYKICDFGTTKTTQKLQTEKVGTPYYLAPEQIDKSFGEQTQKVDIWAFGALTYELLTNEPLFNGMTAEEIYDKILKVKIESILLNKIKIDRKWQGLLLNMLNRDQNQRYDINKIIEELERNASVIPNTRPQFNKQPKVHCDEQKKAINLGSLDMPKPKYDNLKFQGYIPAPSQFQQYNYNKQSQQHNVSDNNLNNQQTQQQNYAASNLNQQKQIFQNLQNQQSINVKPLSRVSSQIKINEEIQTEEQKNNAPKLINYNQQNQFNGLNIIQQNQNQSTIQPQNDIQKKNEQNKFQTQLTNSKFQFNNKIILNQSSNQNNALKPFTQIRKDGNIINNQQQLQFTKPYDNKPIQSQVANVNADKIQQDFKNNQIQNNNKNQFNYVIPNNNQLNNQKDASQPSNIQAQNNLQFKQSQDKPPVTHISNSIRTNSQNPYNVDFRQIQSNNNSGVPNQFKQQSSFQPQNQFPFNQQQSERGRGPQISNKSQFQQFRSPQQI